MYTNTHLSFKEENSKTNNARTFSLEQNMISLHCIHAAVIYIIRTILHRLH